MSRASNTARRLGVGLTIAALGLIQVAPAFAENMSPSGVGAWPKIGTETEVDIEYDHASVDHLKDGGALNVQVGQQVLVEFDNHWSASTQLTLQPFKDPTPGKESFLDDHGLFVEELYGRWNNQKVNIKFGKFAQNFARAWYLTPGLYGQDFVGDYGIGETLGVEGQFELSPAAYGLHTISVSAFKADTTVLSQSVFFNRGQVRHQDGGPGNTQGLKSTVVSYDAINVPLGTSGGLDYQISYAVLGKGVGADGPERRTAVGFDVNLPVHGTIERTLQGRFNEFRILAEAVRLDRADGINGQQRDYLTGAVEFVHGPWVFDLTATDRWSKAPGVSDIRDELQSLAVGYSLPSDTFVALGLAHEKVAGEDGVFAGLQISQTLSTCDRCLIRGRHY